jgi:hypothetical protein
MVSWRRALVAGGAATLAALSCGRDKDPSPGEVMVQVTTDLQVPGDLDRLQVVVSANGVTQLNTSSTLGPNGLQLPATFGVIAGAGVAPSTPATIDVIGYRANAPQIVNEAVVTIPESGIVVLQMPLDFLCLGNLKSNPAAADSGLPVDGGLASGVAPYVPDCESGYTCSAGSCAPDMVSPSSLPVFIPGQTSGGSATLDAGACFSVTSCFATSAPVTPGPGCTIHVPSALELNFAIVTSTNGMGEGTCLGETCLVPLDEGPGGWTLSGNTVTLPTAVCTNHEQVVKSAICPSKAAAMPVCAGRAGALPDGGPPTGTPDATMHERDSGARDAMGGNRDAQADGPVTSGSSSSGQTMSSGSGTGSSTPTETGGTSSTGPSETTTSTTGPPATTGTTIGTTTVSPSSSGTSTESSSSHTTTESTSFSSFSSTQPTTQSTMFSSFSASTGTASTGSCDTQHDAGHEAGESDSSGSNSTGTTVGTQTMMCPIPGRVPGGASQCQ